MVLKLLGPTLSELKEVTGRNKLFGKTILKVAIQAVNVYNHCYIFYIHSTYYHPLFLDGHIEILKQKRVAYL